MSFNIKITDLNFVHNPFVILEARKVDAQGFIDLSDINFYGFPWLVGKNKVQSRTFKIEVTFRGQLLLLRFVHFDKFYELEYSKIALRIVNNMIQTNLLRIHHS